MMSEGELHSMRVIGEMLGTTASFLPLSICILYVVCSSPHSALTLLNLCTNVGHRQSTSPHHALIYQNYHACYPFSRNAL